MRKRHGVILAVIGYIVFFFCMEGWGADWKHIGIDAQGSIWELDATSISHQPNNIVRVWLKLTYSQKTLNDRVKDYGPKYKDLFHTIFLDEYSCTEKKFRVLSTTRYSLSGGVIDLNDSPEKWTFITPDSIAEVIFEEVCKQPE